jgi:hypothetical protein
MGDPFLSVVDILMIVSGIEIDLEDPGVVRLMGEALYLFG